jgi:hypothetical protein
LFKIEHRGADARPIMTPEDNELPVLNKLFAEAVSRHGGDVTRVVGEVRAQIAALSCVDQGAIHGALERLLAFRGPDLGGGPIH